jgi:peptidyl-tRNA hydrolase, PTH1 family
MWLVVGLGNPGSSYQGNRHNIGFMAVDALAQKFGALMPRKKFSSDYYEVIVGSEKILLLKPQTFMNESGRAVAECARFYKIPAEQIVVFHDELDLPPAKMRLKFGGGAAGHNGLRSMDDWLTTDQYHRVRLGIGHPGSRDRVSGYVLSDFSKDDQEWLQKLMESLAKHFPLFLQNQQARFASAVAHDMTPPKSKIKKEESVQTNNEGNLENGI